MENTARQIISTGLGDFSKTKFSALISVRSVALSSIRAALEQKGFTEVSMSSLVNVAGSCENPYASFTLPYYGREAHLSQSSQLQLEALVLRLGRGFYTVNNSFREEHYDDPEAQGRRLSEFTLIEPEMPMPGAAPEDALQRVINMERDVVKYATMKVIDHLESELYVLNADAEYLKRAVFENWNQITYDEAIALLNKKGGNYKFGDDLGIKEERQILAHFNNIPTFVTHFPSSLKFFNMKRHTDGQRCYSVDLLMPKLGESTGGAVREENGELIKQYLIESKVGQYTRDKGLNPLTPFAEYFKLFDQEEPLVRGGFGIGFERFVGFLLGSNDILDTIAFRTMQP